jgi:hypothetical protein
VDSYESQCGGIFHRALDIAVKKQMLLRQLNQKKKRSLIIQFSAATVAEHLDFWERFEKDHARMDGYGGNVRFQVLCLKCQATKPGSHPEV